MKVFLAPLKYVMAIDLVLGPLRFTSKQKLGKSDHGTERPMFKLYPWSIVLQWEKAKAWGGHSIA
jgi:hypothetical protein